MRILGIETSCDETGAAVIEAKTNGKNVKLLSNTLTSSLTLHSKTGGIIPEVAAREQVKYIIPVIEQTLNDSSLYPQSSKIDPLSSTIYRPDIDAIAVTFGPGLIGSLLVGVETAKTLAYIWNKPIIPVNHLLGHIYANFIVENSEPDARRYLLDADIDFPALALIVSGGHTDLVLMNGHGKIRWLGGTRDDAAGEAFDKIARLLSLPYPGGPEIEKAATNGNPKAFNFPRPMIGSDDFDFSFSGLKTSVLREIKTIEQLNNETIANIAASVQQAIIDVLVVKTLKAAEQYKVKSILLSGGVAANQTLRDRFELDARRYLLNAKFFFPEKWLCTDNGAMIASAAFFNYKEVPWTKLSANPELYFDL
ncbi:MAG: tRNA (adenosine(37)-N6)-threonylcarbamoyltransferase complex transferase subunit TsaD [Candidatus Levybacteria bacterium]|nr:tRNA (adenosine(37)-N6)-threonylcarbamoyltransferase complex transferase subunit TsaD [Candidatus Levybacteria bacterium]